MHRPRLGDAQHEVSAAIAMLYLRSDQQSLGAQNHL